MQDEGMIKFKRTTGNMQAIQLAYEPNKTIAEYLQDMEELFDAPTESIKLIFKGKILTYKQTAAEAKLKEGSVMVVINQVKKEPKKILTSKEQVVPGAGMSTGLGASSPYGVGGYQMVNHPQYMSAISSAVDPEKMEEMMNDPQTQGMIEEMLKDPDTLRHMINENPMLSKMMKDNPMMKTVLENPELLKMVMNKDVIKRSQELMKNPQNLQGLLSGNASAVNPLMGNPFAQLQQPQMNQPMPALPPMPAFNPNMNPYGMRMGMNPMFGSPMMPNPLVIQMMEEMRFKNQLHELELSGFKDRSKNLRILKEVNGDLDLAIEKLCSE